MPKSLTEQLCYPLFGQTLFCPSLPLHTHHLPSSLCSCQSVRVAGQTHIYPQWVTLSGLWQHKARRRCGARYKGMTVEVSCLEVTGVARVTLGAVVHLKYKDIRQ